VSRPDEGGPAEAGAPRVPGRRGPRRATGGTPPRVPAADAPVPAAGGEDRAPDDTDVGWGEPRGGDDDDRILREVPPHW